jgi:hypothetical protein
VFTASTAYPGWDASKLGDGGLGDGNAWSASATPTQWVRMQNPTPALPLDSYRIVARSGDVTGSPKDWTFEGSNDGSSWTTIDTITNQTGWTANLERTYTPSNVVTAYTYYRMNITATQGGGAAWPSMAEWRGFQTPVGGTSALVDWYRADYITGVSDSANMAVTDLVDQSGNGHNFTTGASIAGGTVAYKATGGPGGPGGTPYMDFSSGVFQSTDTRTGLPSGDLTYFGRIRRTSTSDACLFGAIKNGGATIDIASSRFRVVSDFVTGVATDTADAPLNSWFAFVIAYEKATGITKFNVNGTTRTVAGTSGITFTSSGTLKLGGQSDGFALINKFDGDMNELGRYSKFFSDAERTELMNYMLGV